MAIADWPVVRITKIAESPPEPLPEGDRPASGVRVVDLNLEDIFLFAVSPADATADVIAKGSS